MHGETYCIFQMVLNTLFLYFQGVGVKFYDTFVSVRGFSPTGMCGSMKASLMLNFFRGTPSPRRTRNRVEFAVSRAASSTTLEV